MNRKAQKTVWWYIRQSKIQNATAIDLIDAVYGKVYTIKQDTKSPERWIVIYTTKEVSVISMVNGTTYVEVGELKNFVRFGEYTHSDY